MKKVLLVILFVSTISEITKAQSDTERRNWFLEGGLSFYLAPDWGTGESLVGGMLNIGYYVSPRSFLALEVGGYPQSKKIGTFTYYNTSNPSKIYTDGVITRESLTIPVLFTWNYMFDLSEKCYLHVGPSLGATMLSASDMYDPDDVEGKPSPNEAEETVFSFGANIGVTWNFAKRWFLDGGYRFLGNTTATFEDREVKGVTHQINIAVGWRFGKPKSL